MRVLVRSHKMSVVQWVRGHSATCQTVRKADGKTCNLTYVGMDIMDSTNNHTYTQQCVLTSNPIPTHFIPFKQSSPRLVGEKQTILVMLLLTGFTRKHSARLRMSQGEHLRVQTDVPNNICSPAPASSVSQINSAGKCQNSDVHPFRNYKAMGKQTLQLICLLWIDNFSRTQDLGLQHGHPDSVVDQSSSTVLSDATGFREKSSCPKMQEMCCSAPIL